MDTLWPFHHDRKEPEPGRPIRSNHSEISCVPSGHRRTKQDEDGSWSLNPFSFISSATTPESHQSSDSGLFFVPFLFGSTPTEKKNEEIPRSRSKGEVSLSREHHPISSIEPSSQPSYQGVKKEEEQPSSFSWMSYPFASGPTMTQHHTPPPVSFLCDIHRLFL